MDVEVITDKVPAGDLGIGGHDGLHVSEKIVFLPRRSGGGSQQLSRHHIPTENEGACAVARILKLAALHFSRSQRQAGMLALQGLHPGQFIGTHRPFASFHEFGSLPINPTDGLNGCFSLRINWRSQPVADQMRLEILFFNRRAAWRGEICATMPCAITSSAISRPVQWLIGRSLGCAQASAIIWQVCSAVICAGRPEREVSWSRSLTERSSKATVCKPIQRILQQRTVSAFTPNSLPMCALFLPWAAAKIMRPRSTICWGVLCRRTRSSNALCSRAFNASPAGLGPRICFAPSVLLVPFYHTRI